jgi:carbonic anhydrase/acetyltransferase-like protein (isoleucine patch superfamily)
VTPEPVMSLGELVPLIDEEAYIAPTASVIGQVRVDAEASVWFACVLRGDQGPIRIGARSNVQDGTVLHGTVELGDGVTIGHNCVIHDCRIGDGALIGMGAVVLDGAEIGARSVVAPGAVVTPGTVVPPGVVVSGTPARVRRQTGPRDDRRMTITTVAYVHLSRVYRGVEALDPSVWAEMVEISP